MSQFVYKFPQLPTNVIKRLSDAMGLIGVDVLHLSQTSKADDIVRATFALHNQLVLFAPDVDPTDVLDFARYQVVRTVERATSATPPVAPTARPLNP